MQNVIEARGLRRTYGSGQHTFEAVRGIDLTVRRGELLAILGVNGAGKTSLMEILEGMAPASAGTATVLGHDPHTQRADHRTRGRDPQHERDESERRVRWQADEHSP